MRLESLTSDLFVLRKVVGGGNHLSYAAVAQALARNGPPPGVSDARLVMREEPTPMLGIIGRFTPAGDHWLHETRRFLDHLPRRFRYVDYGEVVTHVQTLAGRLLEELGRERLAAAEFLAIPRGGLIVLGMLAYALGIEADHLLTQQPGSGTAIVVDDCAYTGARFGEMLQTLPHQDIVFAPLFSTPALRQAISHEDRLIGCVSGNDLRDFTATLDNPDGWEQEWSETMSARPRYWVGVTDYLCLPWSEPDWSYWDAASGRPEDGWSVMTPERCLEHHTTAPRDALPVQVQVSGPGPLRPTASVLSGHLDGSVHLLHTETDLRYALDGVSADMWLAIVEHGEADAAAHALTATYQADFDTIRADLVEFVGKLVDLNLLA